ncbi:MAG TPA: hypothetical protein VG456_16645 [Candidatus Sulfopaludibacter sp.]|jgi:hypothetical protein|nr:hypothetical protein [Candidatus Sulfopaludibacter sp.]
MSCGCVDTRPSHVHGLLDTLMSMARKVPYRCRNCKRRFYVPQPVSSERPEEAETSSKH